MTEETTARQTARGAMPGSGAVAADREARDHIAVCMPAEGAYLSVLRTATAGLAARLDFTLDEIEDLRIAVDEACAMLLSQAIPGTSLECDFDLGADLMTIAVSVVAAQPCTPGPGHVRLDRAVRAGRRRGLPAGAGRPGGHRAAEAPRGVGVLMGDFEVRVGPKARSR